MDRILKQKYGEAGNQLRVANCFKEITMKITKALCILLMLISNSSLFAQTENDSLLIEETALSYIEGLFTINYERMEKALHPKLAKKIIKKDDKGNGRKVF